MLISYPNEERTWSNIDKKCIVQKAKSRAHWVQSHTIVYLAQVKIAHQIEQSLLRWVLTHLADGILSHVYKMMYMK